MSSSTQPVLPPRDHRTRRFCFSRPGRALRSGCSSLGASSSASACSVFRVRSTGIRLRRSGVTRLRLDGCSRTESPSRNCTQRNERHRARPTSRRSTGATAAGASSRRSRARCCRAASSAISSRTRRSPALQDVSFTVPRGRTLGVIGRNGSGKSTLLKLVAGITKPTSGT